MLVLLLLIAFIISQIQLYTASIDTLIALGVTARERVNEVFAQLAFAIAIVFSLLFLDVTKTRITKIISYCLITVSLVIAGFALQNDVFYISQFGLSSKRIWGLAVIAWLTIISLLLTIKNFKNLDHEQVLKFSTLTTFILVTIIGLINFDAQIYRFNEPTMIANKTYNLTPINSSDSRHLQRIVSIYEEELGVNEENYTPPDYKSEFEIRDKYNRYQTQRNYSNYLKQKYCTSAPMIGFNFSEYREAQKLC
jgi:hypothetical protein